MRQKEWKRAKEGRPGHNPKARRQEQQEGRELHPGQATRKASRKRGERCEGRKARTEPQIEETGKEWKRAKQGRPGQNPKSRRQEKQTGRDLPPGQGTRKASRKR